MEATFDVTVSIGSDVIGGAPIKNKVTNGSKSIGGFFDMPLDLSFVGKSCFTDPVTGSSTFIGAMIISQPQKKAPEQGYVQFFFTAFGNDGTPGIKYMLEMFGIFGDPANWLPAPGTATILTVADWNMTTEGKGQNRKISCIGPGTFATETTVRIFRRP